MLKKLFIVTLTAGSMMIASAQNAPAQHPQKADHAVTKEAPSKGQHKAKGHTQKNKEAKQHKQHTSKKTHKSANKDDLQEQ